MKHCCLARRLVCGELAREGRAARGRGYATATFSNPFLVLFVFGAGCFEAGLDRCCQSMKEIPDSSVRTLGECQARCEALDNCYFFTFDMKHKYSSPKDSNAPSGEKPGLAKSVPGPKKCGKGDRRRSLATDPARGLCYCV